MEPPSARQAVGASSPSVRADHRITGMLQELDLTDEHLLFVEAGVRWHDLPHWSKADYVDILGLTVSVAMKILVYLKRTPFATVQDPSDAAQHHDSSAHRDASSSTSGGKSGHRSRCRSIDAGRPDSGIMYRINYHTGCAHPTVDGRVLLCGHVCAAEWPLEHSALGLDICSFRSPKGRVHG